MKQLLAILLAGIMGTTAFSQETQSSTASHAKVVINPQIGINMTQLSTDPEGADKKYRLGYHFGGYLRIGNMLYFQPGVFWNRMGFELQTTDEIENEHDFQNDISSIQVPVLLGVNLINSDMITLRANGGGVATFVTSVKDNPLFDEDDFKKAIFGARLGAGADLFGLTADAGYDFGFTGIFKDINIAGVTIEDDTKLNGWFFSLGLKL